MLDKIIDRITDELDKARGHILTKVTTHDVLQVTNLLKKIAKEIADLPTTTDYEYHRDPLLFWKIRVFEVERHSFGVKSKKLIGTFNTKKQATVFVKLIS